MDSVSENRKLMDKIIKDKLTSNKLEFFNQKDYHQGVLAVNVKVLNLLPNESLAKDSEFAQQVFDTYADVFFRKIEQLAKDLGFKGIEISGRSNGWVSAYPRYFADSFSFEDRNLLLEELILLERLWMFKMYTKEVLAVFKEAYKHTDKENYGYILTRLEMM
jgi:hypothetical protein